MNIFRFPQRGSPQRCQLDKLAAMLFSNCYYGLGDQNATTPYEGKDIRMSRRLHINIFTISCTLFLVVYNSFDLILQNTSHNELSELALNRLCSLWQEIYQGRRHELAHYVY